MDERERANDELVTRFCREWDAPYLTSEAMAPYFTDDAVYHNIPLPPIEGGAGPLPGCSAAAAPRPKSVVARTLAGSSTTRPQTATPS